MTAWGKFFVGLALVFLIGVGATILDWFPGSTSSAQQRLQRQAEFALADANADWAQITVDGQKAILSGVAPSQNIHDDTVAAIKDAVWSGGLILGGITTVDARMGAITASVSNENATAIEIAAPSNAAPNPTEVIETTSPEETLTQEAQQASSLASAPAPAETSSTDENTNETDEPVSVAVEASIDEAPAQEEVPQEAVPEEATALEAADLIPEPSVEEQCQPILEAAIRGRNITFASARSEIDAATRAQLLIIADTINQCPSFILVIAGHTDSLGGASGNRQLSLYRADAIATFLRSAGVDDTRLQTRGFGESTPIANNSNAAGRAQNRRIEFSLIPDGSE